MGAALAVVVALVGLDAIWPTPLAIVAYRAGVYAWFAESPSYHKEIAVSLFRFAGWRYYAPAQVAMFRAYRWGKGVPWNFARGAMWLYGAEGQGYIPTLFHRGWWQDGVVDTLEEDLSTALDVEREDPKNAGLSEEVLRARAQRWVFWDHVMYPLIARIAIDAGDPFAAHERDKSSGWGKKLRPGELREVERRFEAWRHIKFEPLPKTAKICDKIRRRMFPVMSAGLETSRRCLEAYRREPESEAQWKAFFACGEKLLPPGVPGGLDDATDIFDYCRDALPAT